MLEQLAYEFKPMLAEKNLKLEFEMQPDIFISCDANKMQRVFDNLLRNAVSYCNADTSIKIAAAVSYTHLDVYKRQTSYWPASCFSYGRNIPTEYSPRPIFRFRSSTIFE